MNIEELGIRINKDLQEQIKKRTKQACIYFNLFIASVSLNLVLLVIIMKEYLK